MSTCQFCTFLEKPELILVEDERAAIILNPEGKVAGQLLVLSKEHTTILEQAEDDLISHLGILSNKASTAVFESLGVQGTNILIANGVDAGQYIPHLALHVVPRRENDGIALSWTAQQTNEEQLSMMELQLTQTSEPAPEPTATPDAQPEETSDDYLIQHLKRIP